MSTGVIAGLKLVLALGVVLGVAVHELVMLRREHRRPAPSGRGDDGS